MKTNFRRCPWILQVLAIIAIKEVIAQGQQIDGLLSVDAQGWEQLPDLPGPFEYGVCQIIDGNLHVISAFETQQWILPLNQGDNWTWSKSNIGFKMGSVAQSTMLGSAWVILTYDIDDPEGTPLLKVTTKPLNGKSTMFDVTIPLTEETYTAWDGACGTIEDGSTALCCGGHGNNDLVTKSCFSFKYNGMDSVYLQRAPSLPLPLGKVCYGSNNDVMVVAGGYNQDKDQKYRDVYVISSLEGEWTKVEGVVMPTAAVDGVAVINQAGVMIGNNLVCLGGAASKTHVNTTIVVDVSAGSISEGLTLPNSTYKGCAAVYDGYVYLIGGIVNYAESTGVQFSKQLWRASVGDVLGLSTQSPSAPPMESPPPVGDVLGASTQSPSAPPMELPPPDTPAASRTGENPPDVNPVESSSSSDSSLPVAAIAAGTGVGIVLLICLGLLVILIVRRKKKRQNIVPGIQWQPPAPGIDSVQLIRHDLNQL